VEQPVDAEIARWAAPQHGVLSREQLLGAGLDAKAIDYRFKVGRLHRVHRGVYSVGHVSPSPLTRAMAAVLACGTDAVLSHRWAAALWEIHDGWRGPGDVTARRSHPQRGIRLHRSRTLGSTDLTVHFGIPVTTPARTLLDLADVLDDRTLARAVNEARIRRLVSLEHVAALMARSPGRRAAGRLRRFADRPTGPTRSTLEDEFLAFTERYWLPRPEVNQVIAGYEVDLVWRRERLVVELDSRTYHDHDDPFESDRDRDADLLAAGYPVVRVTWRRLKLEPAREAERLHRLLRTRTEERRGRDSNPRTG
jgi:Transcriptional regulator, AbiEi antitoxin/Protein of unknown function (DUF559)